ncbi:MAG TPA: ISAs1 family transposase [Firmicutes bacterium]|nr:ISAs1 family transposase [Bacillota bacterium]
MSNSELASLVVRLIHPDEEPKWDELMRTHHYLGFERLVGESLKYVAILCDQWVALIGWGTAAFKCVSRDRWIGWSPEQQWQRLRFITNNQRFLILPGSHIPNLASKALSLNLRRLSADWQAIFGHPVVLAETFVDPSRFAGTCYLAANWTPLGRTRGFGRNGGRYYHHGNPKTVLVYPIYPDARALLSAPFLSPILQGKEEVILDLNTVNLDTPEGLFARLKQLPDPRHRRGIRHSQVSVLAVAICAVLCGARNFVAIGQWAASQPQYILRRLGCRYHPARRRYIPPSEPTLRRTLQSVDADLVDQVINKWLSDQKGKHAIAVDGKTLRGSGSIGGKPLHLMAALIHKEGIVASQREVDSKSNEIPAFKPLLEPLDLEGVVVTADALHAQADHARYLVEEKRADYLFTVKSNQPSLFEDIATLEESDFSPSAHRKR